MNDGQIPERSDASEYIKERYEGSVSLQYFNQALSINFSAVLLGYKLLNIIYLQHVKHHRYVDESWNLEKRQRMEQPPDANNYQELGVQLKAEMKKEEL